ncbi:MAG: glutamine--tRNA ligase/YqeY domain fusion protein [Firmicutes bacterium]|nr:glutamine--tRNA ligase/YqeY domain fusion protein [Bacillota bacterium]
MEPTNFIEDIIIEDLKTGKHKSIVTRFPPEPNGYLHIGHAKSICLNFGLAEEYDGVCHLRFDDTDPASEDPEFVEAIKRDVKWLGFDWGDNLFHAADYFEALYEFAVELIENGNAYVDDLSPEEIRKYRGSWTEPGKNSPYRERSIEENLDLFKRMRAGEFPDGAKVLRAKIDMGSPNMNMRDPIIYRIKRMPHHRTGDDWVIYPMYDFAHPLSDALEHITHSICTLEFEDNRPLYDWFLENTSVPSRPRQIEFARLNLAYTITSKRRLARLVELGHVGGWDDPRVPTIAGLKRRGYTPESIRDLCERVGVAKNNSLVDMAMLEHCVREDLNKRAPRRMAVLRPLKVVIENFPEDKVVEVEAINNPEDPSMGKRKLPLTREIYIEQEDFMEDPPRRYRRLAPGREVRLRYGYVIKCEDVIKNDEGEVVELRVSCDFDTLGGKTPDGRKVRGIIHWVSAEHAVDAEVRLYDRLFTVENPAEREDFVDYVNPKSLEILTGCKLEPSLKDGALGSFYQFERQGYFCIDTEDSKPDSLVFNRTVALRDTWAKIQQRNG